MFWKTQTPSVSGRDDVPTPLPLELRDVLRDRLRLALAFATLGAYEDGKQVRAEGCASDTSRGAVHRLERRHAQGKAQLCGSGGDARCSAHKTAGSAVAVKRSRIGLESRRRRGGQVAVPQQPCVW